MTATPPGDPYARRVHRVMDYVRRHLDADLSLDALARVAHFSPYHFHRIFKATTGETVTRHVQRVRLERACYLMMGAPSRPLGSIAHEVGFSAQSDFSRVFKQRYGVAPSRWDRRTRLDAQGLDDYDATVAALRAELPVPTVRVIDHAACRVAAVRMRFPFPGQTLEAGYRRLIRWLEARGVDWRAAALLGWSWDNYETTPLDQVRFDLGFVVDESVEGDDAVRVQRFPAVRAAEIECDGHLGHVAVAWDHLYTAWLPASGFEPDEMPGVKRFVRRPDETGWDIWHVACSIALRPLRP